MITIDRNAHLGAHPDVWSICSGEPQEVTSSLDDLDMDARRLAGERRLGIASEARLVLIDGESRIRDGYDAAIWTDRKRLAAEVKSLVAEVR